MASKKPNLKVIVESKCTQTLDSKLMYKLYGEITRRSTGCKDFSIIVAEKFSIKRTKTGNFIRVITDKDIIDISYGTDNLVHVITKKPNVSVHNNQDGYLKGIVDTGDINARSIVSNTIADYLGINTSRSKNPVLNQYLVNVLRDMRTIMYALNTEYVGKVLPFYKDLYKLYANTDKDYSTDEIEKYLGGLVNTVVANYSAISKHYTASVSRDLLRLITDHLINFKSSDQLLASTVDIYLNFYNVLLTVNNSNVKTYSLTPLRSFRNDYFGNVVNGYASYGSIINKIYDIRFISKVLGYLCDMKVLDTDVVFTLTRDKNSYAVNLAEGVETYTFRHVSNTKDYVLNDLLLLHGTK